MTPSPTVRGIACEHVGNGLDVLVGLGLGAGNVETISAGEPRGESGAGGFGVG